MKKKPIQIDLDSKKEDLLKVEKSLKDKFTLTYKCPISNSMTRGCMKEVCINYSDKANESWVSDFKVNGERIVEISLPACTYFHQGIYVISGENADILNKYERYGRY